MNRYRNGNGWDGRQDPLEYSREVMQRRRVLHNKGERRRYHNGPRHVSEIIRDAIEETHDIAEGNGPSKEQSANTLELLKGFSK